MKRAWHAALAAVVVSVIASELVAEVPVAFVSRKFASLADARRAAPESGVVVRATYGHLMVRDEAGVTRSIVDGARSPEVNDVADPDVSWDGRTIVFAGYSRRDHAWRIFEVARDGTGLRQVTSSDRELDLAPFGDAGAELGFDRYDDLDPCYLADGRICFVSTRYPGRAPDGRARATNLYVVNADGSDAHRITSERFGADTPAVDPTTGMIVYSRWWRTNKEVAAENDSGVPAEIPPGSPGYGGEIDPSGISFVSDAAVRGVGDDEFPGVNSWFLSSIRPDGTDLAMFSGFKLSRELTQAYRPAFFASGQAVALFIPQTPHIGLPGLNGVRLYERGATTPEAVDGPQRFSDILPRNADGVVIGPDGDVVMPPVPGLPFRLTYASAVPLDDGRILASAATAPDFVDYDLWIIAPENRGPTRLSGYRDTAELDAVPLVPRPRPPVLEDRNTVRMAEDVPQTVEDAIERFGSFEFVVENIFFNAPVDVPIPNAPAAGHGLEIEFWMAPQGPTTAVEAPVLVARKAIPADGKVTIELPAGVPLFEVLRRPDGEIAQGRDGQIFHVGGMNFGRVGERGRCVGCHAGHSMMAVPDDASFTNLAGSAHVSSDAQPLFPPVAVDPAVGVPPVNGEVDGLPDFFSSFFAAQNVVDRSTQQLSVWGGEVGREENHLFFRWNQPIEAREAVVWAPSLGAVELIGMEFPIIEMEFPIIEAFTLTTSLRGSENQSVRVRQPLVPETRATVALDPGVAFDMMTIAISIRDAIGSPEFGIGPIIAEVEVLARLAPSEAGPTLTILRGDANCTSDVDISDAIAVLNFLFLAGVDPCCKAASDANDDGALNLTDAVTTLNHLFRGGQPLPYPSERCGAVPMGQLSCDQPSCF